MRIALIVCVAALAAACASEPAKQPAASASTAASSTTTPPASAPAQAAETPEQLNARFVKAAKSYKKIVKEGQTFYCKKEAALGTRMPVEQCLTENELTEQVRDAEATRDRLRAPRGSPCDALMGCGG